MLMPCFSKSGNIYVFKITAVIIFFVYSVLCPISSFSAGLEEGRASKGVSTNSEDGGNIKKGEENVKEKSQEKGERNGLKETGELYEYNSPTAPEESYFWLIFRTIIVLGVLVGAFYYFFRFVTKKTGMHGLAKDVIQILSVVPIGQNKFLQVVDLAGRILVLGVSETSINLIIEIEDRDEIDRIRLLSSRSSPVKSGGFQEYISKYIEKLIGKGGSKLRENNGDIVSPVDIENGRLDYLKSQKERLRSLNSEGHEK